MADVDWGTVVAVLIGAVVASGSQWLIDRRQHAQRDRAALVDACADLIASCENQRNHIWEFRQGISGERAISSPEVHAHRSAFAQVYLMSSDRHLSDALTSLRQAELNLDRAWRQEKGDAPELEEAWEGYKEALDAFSVCARTAVARATTG